MDAKEQLKEIFRFWEYKLDNNLCTPEEIESAKDILMNDLEMQGTISDFAKFYGVSEGNVRATINRKLLSKPKRVLLYPFHKFRKIIPEKWRRKLQ